MAKSVPHYLETAVVESGDTRAEVLLSLVEATEAQTEVLERIAAALNGDRHVALISAIRTALVLCQDEESRAAAHALHNALAEAGELEAGRS